MLNIQSSQMNLLKIPKTKWQQEFFLTGLIVGVAAAAFLPAPYNPVYWVNQLIEKFKG